MSCWPARGFAPFQYRGTDCTPTCAARCWCDVVHGYRVSGMPARTSRFDDEQCVQCKSMCRVLEFTACGEALLVAVSKQCNDAVSMPSPTAWRSTTLECRGTWRGMMKTLRCDRWPGIGSFNETYIPPRMVRCCGSLRTFQTSATLQPDRTGAPKGSR